MYCWISTAVLSYAPTRAAREREVPCGGIYVTTHIWRSLNHMHTYTHMRTAPHCTYTTVYILNHCYALFEQEKWKNRAKERKSKVYDNLKVYTRTEPRNDNANEQGFLFFSSAEEKNDEVTDFEVK